MTLMQSECSLLSIIDVSRKKLIRRLPAVGYRVVAAAVIEVAVADGAVASVAEVVPSSSSEEVGHTDLVQLELKPVADEMQSNQDNYLSISI